MRSRFLLCVATLTTALAAACDGPAAAPADVGPAPRDSARQIAYGVRHHLVSAGLRRGELHADVATFDDPGTTVTLRGVRIVFFSAAGDSVSTLTARTGRYDLVKHRVTTTGDVVVRTRDGRQLAAARTTYDVERQRLTCDSACTLGGAPRATVVVDASLREVRDAPRRR